MLMKMDSQLSDRFTNPMFMSMKNRRKYDKRGEAEPCLEENLDCVEPK